MRAENMRWNGLAWGRQIFWCLAPNQVPPLAVPGMSNPRPTHVPCWSRARPMPVPRRPLGCATHVQRQSHAGSTLGQWRRMMLSSHPPGCSCVLRHTLIWDPTACAQARGGPVPWPALRPACCSRSQHCISNGNDQTGWLLGRDCILAYCIVWQPKHA